jgi:dUTP pyrophosphatase
LPLARVHDGGAAGADVCAAVPEPVTLAPGARAFVPAGILPRDSDGYEVQLRPRSGLALRSA